MADGHGLLLPFADGSAPFSLGFECGHVWTKLRETDERVFTMHGTNAEMALRIAEALDLTATSEEIGDGWLEVTFE